MQNDQLKNSKIIDAEKLKIEGYKAETDRIKVTSMAMTPDQIQSLIAQTVQQTMNSPDPNPPPDQQQPNNQNPPSAGFFTPTDNQPNGVI